jgi:hypothetical protein
MKGEAFQQTTDIYKLADQFSAAQRDVDAARQSGGKRQATAGRSHDTAISVPGVVSARLPREKAHGGCMVQEKDCTGGWSPSSQAVQSRPQLAISRSQCNATHANSRPAARGSPIFPRTRGMVP